MNSNSRIENPILPTEFKFHEKFLKKFHEKY